MISYRMAIGCTLDSADSDDSWKNAASTTVGSSALQLNRFKNIYNLCLGGRRALISVVEGEDQECLKKQATVKMK